MTTLVELLSGLPGAATPSEMSAVIAEKIPAFAPHAATIVDALISAGVLRSNQGWSVDQVANALATSNELGVPTEEQPGFQRRLVRLFGVPALWSVAKAYDFGTASPLSMQTCRIITDIRAVFGDSPTERPRSAVIMHNLVLRTYNDDGDQETIHVTLDEADLRALADHAARALDKGSTLRALLREADVSVHRLDQQ